MSKNNQTQPNKILPTTSYSQQLLQQWPALKSLIWQHGVQISQREMPIPLIISDDIINHAINSPYNTFLLAALDAVTKTERLRIALLQQKNESINEAQKQGIDTEARQTVPEDLLEQISITSLETLQKQLLSKIELQHDAWQNNINRWADDIIGILLSNNLELNQDEIAEFKTEERYYDLEGRADELAVAYKKVKQPKFSDYYKLKTRLLIQSNLSRLQLPHTADEINQTLAHCKNYFMQMSHDEMELNSIQTQEISSELGILNRDF